MTKRATAAIVLLAATLAGISATRDPNNLVVHEWGTFTSIAGEDGRPVEWLPLEGQDDLPCFVDRFRNIKVKPGLSGTVRMETPVLYFYTPHETTVDVTVRFTRGLVTEWFPRAVVQPETVGATSLRSPSFTSSVSWRRVTVAPWSGEEFPAENRPSHYYAARHTDAATLRVNGQEEKFLFYRGVGHFPLPVSATVAADGRILLTQSGKRGIEDAILFENRGGRIGYQVRYTVSGDVSFEPPSLDADVAALGSELENMLVGHGLYPREAEAMVETWRDSWFEEGTRVFFILSETVVDSILPLHITPRPAHIARVFVGRLELITTAMKEQVRLALEEEDTVTLARYGRFLRPISATLLTADTPAAERSRIERLLQSVSVQALSQWEACK